MSDTTFNAVYIDGSFIKKYIGSVPEIYISVYICAKSTGISDAEYLSKISRLDSDVSQSDGPQDDSLFPIDEIITITPQPLEDPTAYEEESNWFDSICNWLRNLFGG